MEKPRAMKKAAEKIHEPKFGILERLAAGKRVSLGTIIIPRDNTENTDSYVKLLKDDLEKLGYRVDCLPFSDGKETFYHLTYALENGGIK